MITHIQHLNYCRQISMQMARFVDIPSVTSDFKNRANHLIDLCVMSQKFILPDGGQVINDLELRGLGHGLTLRLPHPFIALEFKPLLNPKIAINAGASKAVLFIREHNDSASLVITAAFFQESDGRWDAYDDSFIPVAGYMNDELKDGRASINFAFPEGFQDIHIQIASVVLGFLNALACSNVHIERSEAKNSGKRIKSSLPFDSYHILTIDTGKTGDLTAVSGGGSHRSPREHLRRGHIVRPGEGRRPFWRNATVVCAGRGYNKVEKDYRVKNSTHTGVSA